MDALVSRALMIRLSLQPSPDSETSAFSNIRAFSNRCAGLFPFRISASSCSRSSALNRTTYLFTEISFAAMIASVVPTVDESESSNPFNLVEAGDYTPKHGSWLDLAESELGVLSTQCLDRRIPDKQTLIDEIAGWEHDRNLHHT